MPVVLIAAFPERGEFPHMLFAFIIPTISAQAASINAIIKRKMASGPKFKF
jgi:hypothetical protein